MGEDCLYRGGKVLHYWGKIKVGMKLRGGGGSVHGDAD